ncbi:MAG: efflux RND transporter periplasmic adaptor subunit [Rhodothermales bacterium]
MTIPTSYFAVLLFAVGLALMAGCGGGEANQASDSAEDEQGHAGESGEDHAGEAADLGPELVRLTAAELEEFEIEIRAAGPAEMRVTKTYPGEVRVNEDRYAHVVPRVPGIVRSVRKNLGDAVRAGETMAVLESRELADAKAEYLAVNERLELARSNFEREERLFKREISSEQEFLEARQRLAEARINVRSATQKLRALGFSADYIEDLPNEEEASLTLYPLAAPFSGTVVEKHITQGEALDGDAGAFEVADLSTVWVDLSIYQQDMALVTEGQDVVITAGGHSDRGKIAYVRPIVGEETRTALARIVLPNPHGRWKPGMFVTGAVALDAPRVDVVVPKSALQDLDGQTVVFVKTADGFEARPVVTADESEGRVAIASGLAPGDEYVASGGFALKSELEKSEMSAGHAH